MSATQAPVYVAPTTTGSWTTIYDGTSLGAFTGNAQASGPGEAICFIGTSAPTNGGAGFVLRPNDNGVPVAISSSQLMYARTVGSMGASVTLF
jgi:hypothetical protein